MNMQISQQKIAFAVRAYCDRLPHGAVEAYVDAIADLPYPHVDENDAFVDADTYLGSVLDGSWSKGDFEALATHYATCRAAFDVLQAAGRSIDENWDDSVLGSVRDRVLDDERERRAPLVERACNEVEALLYGGDPEFVADRIDTKLAVVRAMVDIHDKVAALRPQDAT